MELKKSDFKQIGHFKWESKCGKYRIYKDSAGYWYPSKLYYRSGGIEDGNFFCNSVHVGYDYSFSFDICLQVLNMVIDGTWKTGQGTHLNGIT